MENNMNEQQITATDVDGKRFTGTVKMVYNDAIASGTNGYVSVTYVMCVDENNNIRKAYPRDIHSFNVLLKSTSLDDIYGKRISESSVKHD